MAEDLSRNFERDAKHRVHVLYNRVMLAGVRSVRVVEECTPTGGWRKVTLEVEIREDGTSGTGT